MPHAKKEENKIKSSIEKIILNAGLGRMSQMPNFEDKALEQVIRDVMAVTGQKPQVTKARKSISSFKLREGQIIGVKATLRGQKMVDFFERLVRIVLPRVHDFRGLDPKSIDRGGTLNIGLREQFVFPEINAEESQLTFSLGVNIVPKNKHRAKAEEAYRELGVPFMK